MKLAGLLNGVVAVHGFCANSHVISRFEQRIHSATNQLMIIHHQYSTFHNSLRGTQPTVNSDIGSSDAHLYAAVRNIQSEEPRGQILRKITGISGTAA